MALEIKTPLISAISERRLQAAKILLKLGANPQKKVEGRTALELALYLKLPDFVSLFR